MDVWATNQMKLLFVCYANICRSPTAEGIMRKLIDENGIENIEIDSAGIHAFEGDAPDINAMKCAAKHSVDLTSLRSRPIRADDFAAFDLIVAMDEDTVEYLKLKRPLGDDAYQKATVKNILDYAPEYGRSVPNPYGTNGFDSVFEIIDTACRKLLKTLLDK